jgi:SAM-dependent methyltransferase
MGAAQPPDRRAWLRKIRDEDEAQEDAPSSTFDERWGEIEATHRSYVERFLAELPSDGHVLDAACGTGKYFGIVTETGRSVTGVDHSRGQLAVARQKYPGVPTERCRLGDLAYQERFDGVMCVDAMEFVPPEDWPVVLARFRRALRPRGWLYFTIEQIPAEELVAMTEQARRSGLPVVEGEVLWKDPQGDYYHHYPSLEQAREWLANAGFAIVAESEGPWDDGYAYYHMLSRVTSGPIPQVR